MGSYGPPPKTFVRFEELPANKGQVTKRWQVLSHDGHSHLGTVRFYPQWRCYVLEPDHGTVWSWECLAETERFLKARTLAWRESKRRKK